MTDNEIIKALECCCAKENCEVVSCEKCPLEKHYECTDIMFHETLDLINRQKEEIERLGKGFTADADYFASEYDNNIKAEAIKEFAKQVKMAFYYEFDELIPSIMADKIDNLVKEMTEVSE